MRDLADLEALIAQLAKIDFAQSSEQATREMAVNPIIGALGWNTFDPDEVAREYSVHGGRVDYCLRVEGRNLVLIEVKRAGTDLGEHQEQLLRYAFNEGVALAALTDGLVWWLYLPTAGVSWEQRRFFRVDFGEDGAADAASNLDRFLDRRASVSGAALKEAQREFAGQERDRRVRAALQVAWRRVLGDPQGLLRDLLAEEVREISGHEPDHETVAGFLRGVIGGDGTEEEPPVPSTPQLERTPTPGQKAATTRQQRMIELLDPKTHVWEWIREDFDPEGARSVTGRALTKYQVIRDNNTGIEVKVGRGEMIKYAQVMPPHRESRGGGATGGAPTRGRARTRSVRPAAFRLDGARHEVETWRGLLVQVCEQLAKDAGPAFAARVASVRGRTRVYFSRQPETMRTPLAIANSGLYVEGHVSAKLAERIARRTMTAVRGSDQGLSIEFAD